MTEDSRDDVAWFEAAAQSLRAKRLEEETARRKQRSLDFDWLGSSSNNSSTCGEMTESASSFLSWASSSHTLDDSLSSHTHGLLNRRQLRHPVKQRRPTSDWLANLSSFDRQTSVPSCEDYGEFSESLRQLQYTPDDLCFLAFGENRDFYKLQSSLRREGAITNELLKQTLSMVVLQSRQRRKMRERMVEQQRQQALEKILEMEPDQQARDQEKDHSRRKTARAKSPIQNAFSFFNEEKKEELV